MHGEISSGGLPRGERGRENVLQLGGRATGHAGAARRGLILLPGFFIVDTDRFVPGPNNYAALDRLDLGGETTGVVPPLSPPPRRGGTLRVMRDPMADRAVMRLIRTPKVLPPGSAEMFTKESSMGRTPFPPHLSIAISEIWALAASDSRSRAFD